MNQCIICNNTGKSRKYFFKDKPLCDTDYTLYLEFLIQGMTEKVTTESANEAYRQLEITLKPEPPRPTPKPYNDEPYSMRMGM